MDKEILEKIENPIVKRALRKRYGNFMFNYGDTHRDGVHTESTRETEKPKKGGKPFKDGTYYESFLYKDYQEYSDHDDWSSSY